MAVSAGLAVNQPALATGRRHYDLLWLIAPPPLTAHAPSHMPAQRSP